MKALFQIPYRTPPTLGDPSKWSAEFEDFVSKCLVKKPKDRWSVDKLLEHPWLQDCPGRDVLVDLVRDYLKAKAELEAEEQQEPIEEQTEEEKQAEEILQKLEKSGKLNLSIPAIEVKPVEANVPLNDASADASLDGAEGDTTRKRSKSKSQDSSDAGSGDSKSKKDSIKKEKEREKEREKEEKQREKEKKDSMKKEKQAREKEEREREKEEKEREKAAAAAAKKEKHAREKEEKERKKNSMKEKSKRDKHAETASPGMSPNVDVLSDGTASKNHSLKDSELSRATSPGKSHEASELVTSSLSTSTADDKDKKKRKHDHKRNGSDAGDAHKDKRKKSSQSSEVEASEKNNGPEVGESHTDKSAGDATAAAATSTSATAETTTAAATAAATSAGNAGQSSGGDAAAATTTTTNTANTTGQRTMRSGAPMRPKGEPMNRPRTVHHGTARRTAEIRQNINRRLLRRQLAEIKALTKQHQRDYDLLEAKQSEQKAKIHKFWSDKLNADQTKRSREDDKISRRVAMDREAETRRFKADVEALTRQQQGLLKTWIRDFTQEQRALLRLFDSQVAQRAKDYKESEKAKDKESKNVAKKLREQQKIDRKQEFTDQEEEYSLLFNQQIEMSRVFDENMLQLSLLDEANNQLTEQKKMHFAVEYKTLFAAHERQMEALKSEIAIQTEAMTQTHEYEEEALKQMQFLAKEQLARRFMLESQQQERQQLLEQRDSAKVIRQQKKKMLDEFISRQKEELRASTSDKKQALKEEQKAEKEEYSKKLAKEEEEENNVIKKKQEDDDEILRSGHVEQSAALMEIHEAQRVEVQNRHEQEKAKLEQESQQRIEDLKVRQCKELVTLMRQEQIEMGGVVREAMRAHFVMRAENQKRELDQITSHLQVYKVMVVRHQNAHMDLLGQRHALQLQLWEKEKKHVIERDVIERQQKSETAQQRRIMGVARQQVEDAIRLRREILDRTHDQQMDEDAESASRTRSMLAQLLEESYTRNTDYVANVIQPSKSVVNTIVMPKPVIPGTPYD